MGNSTSPTLVGSQLLTSQHGDIMYDVGTSMNNGKRLALRFTTAGEATYEEVTRGDVLKLIQAAASPLLTYLAETSNESKMLNHAFVEIPNTHMRDLRKLDNVFAISNEPSLTVRQQAILVNADPVRAVILRDSCLVFLPDGADSLVSLLKTCFKEQIIYSNSIAFEFAAIEAVLQTICKVLTNDVEKLLPVAKIAIDRMARDDMPLGDMESIRSLKNNMHELNTQISGMRRMLMDFLENDEDVHMLYLTKIYNESRLARDVLSFDTEDAESLLEVYLQDIYASQTRVALMLNNMQNTESMVMLKLDTKRNYLLTVDLTLTMWTTMVTVSTFVVGGFGMNLNSNIQQMDNIFWIVIGLCVLFPIVSVFTINKYLERRGISMSWKTR
ncbi:CorA Metal Ion Transporter (MIT) Family [Thraustotheca clavata]|uniref:Magnesium transporter n=1 Tax=Thraustotheca clavata TaxID=74557 RepID=A0A1V9YSI0_9STRA|nr:CorA Metal Ion Transporter (MIT) Family [Thraustotheca clavata]